MKKTLTAMLALALALSLSGTVALASSIPSSNVNPQQKGHVAYLESTYGKQEANKILKGYGRAQDPPKHTPQPPTYIPPWNGGIIIPPPGPSEPVWGSLKVGDYFSSGGQLYIVSRITVITGSSVLIAYPVNYGIIDYMNPRYFYI